MPTEVEIASTDEGRLALRGNELLVFDKTNGDPCAVRFRTYNETAGKLTFDIFIEGAWREFGYISGKQDERGRTDPAHRYAPEFEFWGHKPNAGWNDSDYERLFAVRHDGFIAYKGGGGGGGASDTLISNNGKFAFVIQGDGNAVTYRRNQDGSLGAAVWASGYTEP